MPAKVIQAYKTDFFPNGGSVSEEVLVLENDAAIYRWPGAKDSLFLSLADLKKHGLVGNLVPSQTLLESWKNGYPPKQE